jgi:hypothetical protein
LVGRDGELTIDAADGFALGDEQVSQICCEMVAFRGVGKQVAILDQEVLDESGKLDDRWHRSLLTLARVQQSLAIVRHFTLTFNFAKLRLSTGLLQIFARTAFLNKRSVVVMHGLWLSNVIRSCEHTRYYSIPI